MSMKSNTRMPSIIFNPLKLVILPFGSSIMDKTKCFQVDSNYGNEKKKERGGNLLSANTEILTGSGGSTDMFS